MRFLLRLTQWTPQFVKRWLYRHQGLRVATARLLKSAVTAEGTTVITIKDGPNRGTRLAVDASTPNFYWVTGDYEKDVIEAMRPLVKAGDHVADIGAHIGFDTLLLSRWVGPTGRVLSFEPDPQNMRRLARNCELNAAANVELHAEAVSDAPGVLQFAADGLSTSHMADGSAYVGDAAESAGASKGAGDGAGAGCIEVPGVTVDDVLFAGPQPALALVKIDVEDHEVAVLRGAQRTLAELRPAVIIEVHSPASLSGCVGELRRHGYRLSAMPAMPCYQRIIDDPGADATQGFERAHLLAVPE